MGTVLVTGAARGIGRASAILLARGGWEVVAGVRNNDDAETLRNESPTIRTVLLDITVPEQVEALDAALPERLDAVVNNAGVFGVSGPLEAMHLDELRRHLEVNVVGQLAVTQAVLPRLRASKGRVVFVSSLSGRISAPLIGAYCASKFALEGMADALRVELRPWGIRVSIIEPAQTDTDVWRNAAQSLAETEAVLDDEHRSLYTRHLEGWRRAIPMSQRIAAPADSVAATIQRALNARRPRARYLVGAGATVQKWVGTASPTALSDATQAFLTGVPRRM